MKALFRILGTAAAVAATGAAIVVLDKILNARSIWSRWSSPRTPRRTPPRPKRPPKPTRRAKPRQKPRLSPRRPPRRLLL